MLGSQNPEGLCCPEASLWQRVLSSQESPHDMVDMSQENHPVASCLCTSQAGAIQCRRRLSGAAQVVPESTDPVVTMETLHCKVPVYPVYLPRNLPEDTAATDAPTLGPTASRVCCSAIVGPHPKRIVMLLWLQGKYWPQSSVSPGQLLD